VDGQVCSVPPEQLKALVVKFVFGSGPALGQAAEQGLVVGICSACRCDCVQPGVLEVNGRGGLQGGDGGQHNVVA
jgi:hypothetical protein